MDSNHWQETPISEIYEGLYDGPHATPKPADDGPVFLGIKNITEDGQLDLAKIRHISEEEYPKWTRRVEPREGDIVFTYEATLNRYAIIPSGFRGCLGRRMALIRPNLDKIDIRFLHFYFFGAEWREVISTNTLSGATVDRIPLTNFPSFKIRYPNLESQHKIASVLSAYDDLIENNTKRISILEEMAQRLYREWFVGFRFPGHETIKPVDSPLGQIPEGFEEKDLIDACELTMGQSPKSEFYNKSGEGTPFHQGVTDFGPHFPTDRLYCTVDKRIAKAGDILFSVRAPVGRINIADKRIVLGRGLSAIRHKQGYQAFLYYQLKEKFQKEDLMGGGTIFNSVTKSDMQKIKLIMPSTDLIDSFTGHVVSLFDSVKNLTNRNQILRQTRDLLLSKLISGEVDVSGLDIQLNDAA